MQKLSDVDLKKYQDLGGLSNEKMNFGLWLATNRKYFILGFILLMIGISAILYGFSTFKIVRDYFDELSQAKIALKQSQDAATKVINLQAKTAKDLKQYPAQMFALGEKYDFVTKIDNPNPNFDSTFTLCFYDGDTSLVCQDDFILPGESKYFVSLANSITSRPVNLKAVIKDMKWDRIDIHAYPDWNAFSASHINFNVTDTVFKTPQSSGLSDKLELNYLEFNITNNTAYGYYDVPLNIIFSSGQQIVGVNRYVLSNFLTGEKRPVRLSWAGNIGSDASVTVVPDLNILRPNIYVQYK
jgi:hypothetical protein